MGPRLTFILASSFVLVACEQSRERPAGRPGAQTPPPDSGLPRDTGVVEDPIECAGGRILCDDRCVDPTSDPLHCSSCTNVCNYEIGEVCQDSDCVVLADCTMVQCIGLSYCDLATKHCKPGCERDEQCGTGEVCNTQTHECQCDDRFHRCSGQCVSSDAPRTCGDRCEGCPSDPNGTATCVDQMCGIECNSATHHLCNNTCAANNDVASCGTSCSACPIVAGGVATCDGQSCGIECNAGTLFCQGVCATCPAGTSFACNGAECVPDNCGSGQRLCEQNCAPCPQDPNASSFDCNGAQCVIGDCSFGTHRLCEGSCATCPTTGVASTTCDGASCAVFSCQSGYELCNGTCSLCPTDPGASTFACSGSTCEIDTCLDGYYRCGSACCPFTTETVATGVSSADARHSDIEIVGGTIHVSYSFYGSSTSLYYGTKSGASWTTEYVTAGGYDNQLEIFGGVPYIAHHHGSNWEVYLSDKNGGSWGHDLVDTLNRPSSPIGFDIDSVGTMHILYDRDALYDTYYAVGVPGEWALSQIDSDAYCTIGSGELQVGTDNIPRAAYCAYSELEYADLLTGSWVHTAIDTTRNVDDVSMAVDRQNYVHIAYYDSTGDDLWYAFNDGSGWTYTNVDSTGNVGEYADIAIDAFDRPHISYYDASWSALKYAYYDGSRWHITTVDSSGAGQYTAITIDSIGGPHIVYADDNLVRYAH